MTDLPNTEAVNLHIENGWLTISIATPHNRNALTSTVIEEMLAALDHVQGDRSVHGITLRGEGGVFCAGGDLKGFKAAFHGGGARDDVIAANLEGGALFHRVQTAPQTIIASIEGAAIAGGLGLACCADIVISTPEAKFALTETQLGITPAQIAPHVARRVGVTTARRLMLTGARFKGDEAKALGLVDFLAEDASALSSLETELKKQVFRCAPGANAATKDLLNAAARLEGDALRQYAAERFADCMMSDEGREGIAAFIEKRKPRWAQEREDAYDA